VEKLGVLGSKSIKEIVKTVLISEFWGSFTQSLSKIKNCRKILTGWGRGAMQKC
jgi:hypothetical protein